MPQVRGPAVRERILERAGSLFVRDGFDHVSVRTLAAEAEVAVATVYAHFDDKDGVIDAVVDRRIAELGQRLMHAAAGRSGVDAVVAGLRALEDAVRVDPLLAALIVDDQGLLGPSGSVRAHRVYAALGGMVLAGLEYATALGEAEIDDVAAVASAISAAVRGWLATSRSEPASAQAIDGLVELLGRTAST